MDAAKTLESPGSKALKGLSLASEYINYGFTTLRDLGSADPEWPTVDLRNAINAGRGNDLGSSDWFQLLRDRQQRSAPGSTSCASNDRKAAVAPTTFKNLRLRQSTETTHAVMSMTLR